MASGSERRLLRLGAAVTLMAVFSSFVASEISDTHFDKKQFSYETSVLQLENEKGKLRIETANQEQDLRAEAEENIAFNQQNPPIANISMFSEQFRNPNPQDILDHGSVGTRHPNLSPLVNAIMGYGASIKDGDNEFSEEEFKQIFLSVYLIDENRKSFPFNDDFIKAHLETIHFNYGGKLKSSGYTSGSDASGTWNSRTRTIELSDGSLGHTYTVLHEFAHSLGLDEVQANTFAMHYTNHDIINGGDDSAIYGNAFEVMLYNKVGPTKYFNAAFSGEEAFSELFNDNFDFMDYRNILEARNFVANLNYAAKDQPDDVKSLIKNDVSVIEANFDRFLEDVYCFDISSWSRRVKSDLTPEDKGRLADFFDAVDRMKTKYANILKNYRMVGFNDALQTVKIVDNNELASIIKMIDSDLANDIKSLQQSTKAKMAEINSEIQDAQSEAAKVRAVHALSKKGFLFIKIASLSSLGVFFSAVGLNKFLKKKEVKPKDEPLENIIGVGKHSFSYEDKIANRITSLSRVSAKQAVAIANATKGSSLDYKISNALLSRTDVTPESIVGVLKTGIGYSGDVVVRSIGAFSRVSTEQAVAIANAAKGSSFDYKISNALLSRADVTTESIVGVVKTGIGYSEDVVVRSIGAFSRVSTEQAVAIANAAKGSSLDYKISNALLSRADVTPESIAGVVKTGIGYSCEGVVSAIKNLSAITEKQANAILSAVNGSRNEYKVEGALHRKLKPVSYVGRNLGSGRGARA